MTAARGRRELKAHRTRTMKTAPPALAVPVGLAVAAAGVAILGVASGRLALPDADELPAWVLASIGAVFVLIGIGVAAGAVHETLQGRRRRRRAAGRARWLDDHPWDSRGTGDRWLAQALRAFTVGAVLALFVVPFNYLTIAGDLPLLGRLMFGLGAVVFDLAALAAFVRGALLVARRVRYGPATVRFGRFPFFPGDPVELTLHVPRLPSGPPGAASATLRCIEESYEPRGPDDDVTTVAYAVDEETVALPSAAPAPGGGRQVALRFRPSADAPGTRLGSRPPRYWELEVRAAARGLDFRATFLVPVYARSDE